MARKLIVEIVGDASSLEKTLAGATVASKRFGREISGTVRGTISATGAFEGLGRALAFAGAGYLAGATATEFIRSSIDAARDAGVAQRSLAAQMRASGQSFAASRGVIEQASLSLAKFGFTSEDSERALTVLERGTGSITRSIKLQSVAADLARAKNIDLASAANILAKVFGGQETALRRAVPGLDRNAHGLDLIREAGQKLAGQAAANTTDLDRFNAELHNSKVIIGDALLPTINRILGSLTQWLDRMNRTGRLQRDVNSAIKTTGQVLSALKGFLDPAIGAFKTLGGAVGGTRNELKLLLSVWAGFKITSWVGGLDALAGGVTKVGTEAETSTGKVRTLQGVLGRLAAIGVITIAIELLINKKTVDKAVTGWLQQHGLGFIGGANQISGRQALGALATGQLEFLTQAQQDKLVTQLVKQGVLPKATVTKIGEGIAKSITDAATTVFGAIKTGTRAAAGELRPDVPVGLGQAPIVPLTSQQQLQVGLARNPDSLRLLQQAAAADRAAIAFARNRYTQGKITAKELTGILVNYYGNLKTVTDQIKSINQTASQAAAQAREKAGEFQLPSDVGVAEARAQATGDDRGMIAALQRARDIAQRALRSGRLNAQGMSDAYQTIGDANSQLADYAQKAADAAAKAADYTVPLGLQVDLARAEATSNSTGVLAALRKLRANVLSALNSGKLSLQGMLDAYQELGSVNEQLQSMADEKKQQLAAQRQKAAEQRQAAAQKAAEQAQEARQAAIEAASSYQAPIGLQLQLAKDQAKNNQAGITATLKKMRDAAYAALRSGQKNAQGQIDIWNEIASLNQQLADQTEKATIKVKFRHLQIQKLLDDAGVRLNRATERRLGEAFSQIGPGGTVPNRQHAFALQGAGGIHIHGNLNVTANDAERLKKEVIRQAKRSTVRRGAR